MGIVTRYFIRQIALIGAFVTIALTLAIWLSQSLRLLDIIVNRGLPAGIAGELLVLLLPSLLTVVLPISLFIAVLFVYHRLITDSELVIVRSAGVGNMALARPAIIVAVITTALCLSLTAYGMPASYRAFRDLEKTIRDNHSSVLVEAGVFTEVVGGVTVFARDRTSDGALSGVLVHDVRNPGLRLTYTADVGRFVATRAGPRIVLDTGTYQEAKPQEGTVDVLYFDRVVVDLEELQGNQTTRTRTPKELYLGELFAGPHRTVELQQQMRAEGHQRIIIPIYAMVFTLIAMAALLHGSVHRFGRSIRMGIAVAAVVAVQAAGFALQSLSARIPALAPLMYVVPLAAGAASLMVLIGPVGRTARGGTAWPVVQRLNPA